MITVKYRKTIAALGLIICPYLTHAQTTNLDERIACEDLENIRNLTIISAEIRENDGRPHIISPAIHFHAQLHLRQNWNGRFLQWGDGGKDGDLDYADHRVAEGYAVTNSNTGHDNGVEIIEKQAEIDFAAI